MSMCKNFKNLLILFYLEEEGLQDNWETSQDCVAHNWAT
jgi:hypothetical protein